MLLPVDAIQWEQRHGLALNWYVNKDGVTKQNYPWMKPHHQSWMTVPCCYAIGFFCTWLPVLSNQCPQNLLSEWIGLLVLYLLSYALSVVYNTSIPSELPKSQPKRNGAEWGFCDLIKRVYNSPKNTTLGSLPFFF